MTRRALPAAFARPVTWLLHRAALVTRPLTMGVRAVVFDAEGRVLLLRHSYVPGWHFPGGAVEPGETARHALARELREETGLLLGPSPVLHGLFLNRFLTRRDHVAVYVVRGARPGPAPSTDWEIVERGFFSPAALPEHTTSATRRRLAEILDGAEPGELW